MSEQSASGTEHVDRHGRVANHPNEFRALSHEFETFDPKLVLGYFRRLEVLLNACPLDIYAASSLKHPWPYRLQNAAECYPASFWRSPVRLLDSAISAPELTNCDVLDHAVERHATAVAAKDYLPFDAYDRDELTDEQVAALDRLQAEFTDNIEATTESIREFAQVYDATVHPPAYVPVQPPYAEHIQEVYSIVEDSDLRHRYMLGGLAQATPERRIDELLSFRGEVGPDPVAHGLGWGLDDELVLTIRDEPSLLDSVDNSSPSQAAQNGQVLDKHWQARDCPNVDGLYQNSVHGAFEFAMLVQATHRLTEFNDDLEQVAENATLSDFGGVEADD